ncbi:YbaK/EbsC family protein [Pelotalea chapellei]|uniref:YbaK/EbsC family protein n=1 Tax=Pelotalea chapellei TaxID=44671 RepID=A0ABS5U8J2_9BACT|nr:YbaK/EbsC family protein [Pelotalea chapellei]MBT1071971.1 YbaK/EbsC family protein [Pelotalea chapellei]
MNEKLSPSARKVQDALDACGVACLVQELAISARTAAEAAEAVNCHVGQIVKSLIFKGSRSGAPVLALVSGKNRVNEALLETACGEPVGKADAAFVRERTGFAIGGIPPLGHLEPLSPIIDQDLLQYPEVWAAGGTPHALFRITPAELVAITGGQTAPLS